MIKIKKLIFLTILLRKSNKIMILDSIVLLYLIWISNSYSNFHYQPSLYQ